MATRGVYSSATQDCSSKFAVARHVYGFPFTQPFPDVDRTRCLIVVGANRKDLDEPCTTVELVGHTGNEAKVENEESKWHPDIFLCRGVRKPLVELWPKLAEFM